MKIHLILFSLIISGITYGQSYWFGPKIGPGLGFQKWNEADHSGLLGINADFFVESIPEKSGSSFYAQIGYHTRGSSLRNGGFITGNYATQKYKFHNAAFELGAKKILFKEDNLRPYYMIGLRAEYTLNTNLKEFEVYGSPYYPNDVYVKKFVYGVSFGGGIEKTMDEFITSFIEFTFSPDVKEQYFQDPIPYYHDPYFGRDITIGERIIRNYSFEIKFGMKFLRKIEYID